MRWTLFYCVLEYLLINNIQRLSYGHILRAIPVLKPNPISCFEIQNTTSPAHYTNIHIDCSYVQRKNPCLSNTENIIKLIYNYYQNVKSLNFEENCIKRVSGFPHLPEIRLVKFRHNAIEFIEDGAFNLLPSLENLDLSHNSLTEMRPEIFKGNKLSVIEELPIKSLHIGYNKIQTLNYLSFERLSKLSELHLEGNPLRVLDSSTVTAIQYTSRKSLRVLNLAKTDLSTLPHNLFAGSKIKAIYINGNNFQQVPEELINTRETLEFLNINENPINILNSDSFFGLHNLKEIVAAGMENLTDINGGTFLHLKSLEQLTLTFNRRLSFIDPNAFCIGSCRYVSSSLKIVHLDHNNLHYLPENLLPWHQIEILSLQDNPKVCSWINEWSSSLKYAWNCSIISDLSDLCTQSSTLNLECGRKQEISFKKSTDYYLIIRKIILVPVLVAGLLTIIVVLIGVIIARLIGRRCTQSLRQIPISNIQELSSSIQYSKLVNKPMFEI